MPITKERLHRAVNSTDLGWNDQRVKDIDILTAMGMTDARSDLMSLGGDLLLLKTSTRSKSVFYVPGNDLYKKTQLSAIAQLSSITRHLLCGIKRDQRDYLAAMVVTEWLNDICEACGGAGRTKNDKGQIIATCDVCAGTGRRYYTHDERKDTLRAGTIAKDRQIDDLYAKRWEAAINKMHEMIATAERAKQYAVAEMLGAW